ncbi:homeodomain-only protein isoform X1 [Pogoniulus pusillus]
MPLKLLSNVSSPPHPTGNCRFPGTYGKESLAEEDALLSAQSPARLLPCAAGTAAAGNSPSAPRPRSQDASPDPSVAGRAPTPPVPPVRRAPQRLQPCVEPCQGEWVPNLNYQPREWLRIGSSCDLRQVFQVPACHTHTQIFKQSPRDLRGSCFTHFCFLAVSVLGPIVLPSEEMATEKPVTPTEEQLEILEYNFCKVNKHPDPTTLCLIAAETGLSEEQTLKWFKQRLAEWRKSEGLPSESGSVRD